jgi:hypothetical protein
MDKTLLPVLRKAQCLMDKTHRVLYVHLVDLFFKKKVSYIAYACVNCRICLNNSIYKTLTNHHWAEGEILMGCSAM